MTSQDIGLIFSALHDGSIIAYTGNQQCLRLTIDCQYLAQRIEEHFVCFYLEAIVELTLNVWLDNEVTELWTNWHKIFASELEVATAEVEGQTVLVWCNQDFATSGSYGGELHLQCSTVTIYDQSERSLSINELQQLASGYWREWPQQNHP